MGRYERRQFFESLVDMRDRYTDRSEDDRPSAPMLIDDAMIYAEAVMLALQTEKEAAALAAIGPAESGAGETTPGEATAGRSTPPDA
jgi:hypothetical protein